MEIEVQPDASIEAMQAVFERQRNSFRRYAPLAFAKRQEALDILLQSIVNHQDILIDAVTADFGQRSIRETRLLEIFPLIDEIRFAKRHLRRWMQTRSMRTN